MACAVRRAANVIVADAAVQDKRADFPEFAMARDFALPARVQGWARRPKRGETYGATYVEPYYDTIAALYARGNVEKNSKVSPDQVREQLVRLHPDKFCLPGVWALQNCFIALGQKKANGGAGGGVHRGRRGRASALPADVVRMVDKMVEGDAKVKPAFVLATVKDQCPQLDSALHKNVKQRVDAKKQQLKKKEASL